MLMRSADSRRSSDDAESIVAISTDIEAASTPLRHAIHGRARASTLESTPARIFKWRCAAGQRVVGLELEPRR